MQFISDHDKAIEKLREVIDFVRAVRADAIEALGYLTARKRLSRIVENCDALIEKAELVFTELDQLFDSERAGE